VRALTDRQIHISEIFASIQGEGPSAGEGAVFLRLAACNLNCVWCDTAYTWRWSEYDPREEVESMAVSAAIPLVLNAFSDTENLLVVTGGEPLLPQPALLSVLAELRRARPGLRVEFETNGTVAPSEELAEIVDLFVVSPKLGNSGVPLDRRIRPRILHAFAQIRSVLKFVLVDPSEIGEAADIAAAAGFGPGRVWLMPEGTSREKVLCGLDALREGAAHAGFHLGSRLHIIKWGDQRGR
jgi:7-carboxy-7-deazaguanine synthase